jgi:hypothetical protein
MKLATIPNNPPLTPPKRGKKIEKLCNWQQITTKPENKP